MFNLMIREIIGKVKIMKIKEITEFIFAEMDEQLITPRKMGELTGITDVAIYYWRKGNRIMTMECAEKMLNALGYELSIKKRR